MKHQIAELIANILKDLGVPEVQVEVTVPEDSSHGDYTTNVAMKVFSRQSSVISPFQSPMEIALSVKEAISRQLSAISQRAQDHTTHQISQMSPISQSISNILSAIDRVEVAPPGFINVFLTEARLGSIISEVLKKREAYGTGQMEKGRRIVVEFTDPNPFKEFHIGHLYSNAVGESLCRLLESQAATVRRVNYQGDVGMHVAKVLYALLELSAFSDQLSDIGKKDIHQKVEFLGKAYAAGSKAFEERGQAKKDIGEMNKKIYVKDPDVYALYRQTRAWSLAYFEAIYARLGTTFAGYYFESAVGERGVRIVREHLNDGVFEESEGAIVYRGEKKGLHTRVFVNQLGLPTYEAKELGLAPTKYDDWPYDRSLIVTGSEINEYFKVLLAALEDVNPSLAAKTKHVGHGMVRKPDGSKMSSRSGVVLTGEGLLDEVKQSIYRLLDKNKSNYTKEEQEEIAEKAAVAAVKYSLLGVSLPSDVAFDLKTSVSFDGDSGPYLLYTYARCKSVLRKAPKSSDKLIADSWKLNAEERAVARLLAQFPDVVAQAAERLAPSTLCTYLFRLAQAYNLFYAKHSILGKSQESKVHSTKEHASRSSTLYFPLLTRDSSFRLSLTAATAQVLKGGLYLLGIEVLEKM